MFYKYGTSALIISQGFCYFYFILVFCYILGAFLIKKIIPMSLVRYEMIIANSALRSSLAVYHLISSTRSWNITTTIGGLWQILDGSTFIAD